MNRQHDTGDIAIRTHDLRKEFRRTVRAPGFGGLVSSIVRRGEVAVTQAVKGLNLEVRRGERIAFIGPKS